MNTWKTDDRVKVLPSHYGTGLQTKLGTVLRVVGGPHDYVEVLMDHFAYGTGIGVVTFKSSDLVETKKKRPQRASS